MMIELAKEEDREEIRELYRMQIGREFCPWTEHYPADEEITFDLSRDALYVMREQGRIIGAISLEEDPKVDALDCWTKELLPGGELARLAVHPEYQDRGLARKLLQFGMERWKEKDMKSIHFLVNRLNEKAIRSYAVFGFRIVGTCEMYEQPFLCYEKEL